MNFLLNKYYVHNFITYNKKIFIKSIISFTCVNNIDKIIKKFMGKATYIKPKYGNEEIVSFFKINLKLWKMEKKSIVLLVVASIILIIAIIFAIWSFRFDLTVAENRNLANMEQSEENNEDEKQSLDMNGNENQINGDVEEKSKTTDFVATYTDFSLEDEEGNIIKLSDYQNHPVMVLFLNYENEDSVEMLKRVNEQYDVYKDTIQFIAIQVNGQEQTNLQDIKVPIYYDKNEEVVKMYNVAEFPTMLYINKENEIFNSKTGLTSVDALTANLDILSENF